MGYKPKYGHSRRRGGIKVSFVLFVLLGVIVVPLSLMLTGKLFVSMYENVGRPKVQEPAKIKDMQIMETFEGYVSGYVEHMLGGLLAGENAQVLDQKLEELTPVRKLYWIEEGTLVAPEPNQECFGQTEDPASLDELLEDAQWILDGQELYFDTDVTLFEGSKVRYYLDDSMFAITWKEVRDRTVYTFSEVKITHPSQFRRHLAGGEFGSSVQYMTTEMAQSVNAVVASSGDFYRFREWGTCVYDREVRRVHGTYAHTCYIDGKGDMHFSYGGEITDEATAKAFVEENDIQFSLAFGPVLVDNYELKVPSWYGLGEITEEYARAALCQMDELHYILITANTEGSYQKVQTVAQFAENVAATGCRMAYCLDGGQTAAIVMNDELINRPVYGTQRKISDIIYFATAVPEGG